MTKEHAEPPETTAIDTPPDTPEDGSAPSGTQPPPDPPPPPTDTESPPGPPSAGGAFTTRYGLIRPRDGRYLAGVCVAIARATGTDPVLWRVLLAVLGFFGGIGILVYVSAWLIMPAEGDSASPIESMLGRGRSSMPPPLVIALVVLVAVMFGFIITDRFRAVLLAAAILIGCALLLNRDRTGPRLGAGSRPGAEPGGHRPAAAPEARYGVGPYRPASPYPLAESPARSPKPPRPPLERSALGGVTFAMIFVVVGVLAILDLAGRVTATPSFYFAAVLITTALGLLAGTWFGRARWLIALGLAAALALGVSALAERWIRVPDRAGSALWRPAGYDALASRYETSFGNGTLDLTHVDFTGRDPQVTVRISFGRLTVIAPPAVDVTATADVNAGDVQVFDQHWSDSRGPARTVTDFGADGPGGGHLRLRLYVNAGDLEVRR